ncbi:hypothetical protein V2K22_12710 [Pseudomonas alliivorans]|nr:hypothetical protein [Pseudomonas alliivorans]MEE4665764.1 hypothetical protein [Pseudomonas alliivorans]MEE4743897.1 hypothetical protein [Pseudomonas alliivorans]MEE4997600.1 hypothetical protein [Pseudomonas alliivorans]MEE5146646.1 hypothetical protein [Pseudomonas alliivorans]
MSTLKEYRAIEKKLDEQLQKFELLRNDDRLRNELELERKLSTLLNRYSLKKKELINFLNSPHVLSESHKVRQKTSCKTSEGKARRTEETRH